MPSSFIRSRCGVTLLNVSLILVLIGGLVIAGYAMMGPIIKRGKITDTKTTINSAVDAIISWSVARGHIPGTEAQFNEASVNQYDAWGRKLRYLYDGNLTTASSTNAICNYAKTNLKINGIGDIAFAILSLGDDYEAQSSWNGAVLSNDDSTFMFASPLLSITTTPIEATLLSPDISRIVTLNELKARIGCAGYTLGQLRIVNNELPSVCKNSSSYSATLIADGGIGSNYSWYISGAPSWLKCGAAASCDGPINEQPLELSAKSSANSFPELIVTLTDGTNPSVSRKLTIRESTSLSCNTTYGYDIPVGTPPDPPVPGTSNPGFKTTNPELIEFGLNNTNSAGCAWYPQNLPLFGKTMRAYWDFCYSGNDTSSNSTQYADGFTFALMQAGNPTTYCGTGTSYHAVTNPRYDCSVWGGAGEYLAYCGLPGISRALEFDIYPSGGRNDTSGSYNHAAIVNAYNHTSGSLVGLFGDNTHNRGGNPVAVTSCYPPLPACNGTCNRQCTGTCNGAAINNASCSGICVGRCSGPGATCTWATPVPGTTVGLPVNGLCTGNNACTGTCDGSNVTNSTCTGTCYGACTGTYNGTALPNTGPGSLYNGYCGQTFPIPAGHPNATTWLEDGCSVGHNNHNARVEIHTRCNTDCSQCGLNCSNTKTLIKLWIDKGNNSLTSNDTSKPDLSYCDTIHSALNQYRVGFTQATGGSVQYGYIKNFNLKTVGSCPLATIAPLELPSGTVGIPYSTTLNANGGTPPYLWSWSASNLSGVTASILPPGLSFSSSGIISGTPTQSGIYNTVLVSLKDACTADSCDNVVSKQYSMKVTCSNYTVRNTTGVRYDFIVGNTTASTCSNNINNNGTITTTLAPDQNITRLSTSQGNCNQGIVAEIRSYNEIAAADLNFDCRVNYGPGGALSDW